MIYPDNFERKIGFDEIRSMLKGFCLSTLGKELVDDMAFTDDAATLNVMMDQIRELRIIDNNKDNFPIEYFFDVRTSLKRIRPAGTHMETEELFDLKRSLSTIIALVDYFNQGDETETGEKKFTYPTLRDLADGIATFPLLVGKIDRIVDKFGKIRDTASPELMNIRRELARTEGSISRTLYTILRSAQSDGIVDKDITPTIRDGRLVIPVAPGMKKKISGIVHDESATGKTVFIEPTQVVEANNRIRELEADERREIIRILTEIAKDIRPYIREILDSYHFLAQIDFIRSKAQLAEKMRAYEPTVGERPYIDWIRARHPLLEQHLNNGAVVPLDIMLTPEQRILIISGPNAGGKSICLKTVGLLQYMLQCGLSIPVSERSKTGVFRNVMIDIGDEQSLENDLSTYSSHLLNMKNMIRQSDEATLLLIDEFGTGTEPQIGGAIAESVLKQFWQRKAWGVITTHYQNLKHFAEGHPGTVNGAMLYDRHLMQPLFQLAIGRPGSSFAIEIARKTGLPEEVIQDASEIVGSDYIQSDKYLQDIVRDKRYWESKRQNIRQREKEMEKTIARYEHEIDVLENSRKEIINRAKAQAEELLRESNKRIENAIREIREKQAEREETKRIREELDQFEKGLDDDNMELPDNAKGCKQRKAGHGTMSDEEFQKKIERIQARKERHQDRLAKKAEADERRKAEQEEQTAKKKTIETGSTVRIKGLTSVGTVESIDGSMATVIFGGMRTKMRADKLELAGNSTPQQNEGKKSSLNNLQTYTPESRMTRATIDNHRANFKSEIDVRGMRADEALRQVQYYIDDAILVGISQVRILHGKGNGILRSLIRDYLDTIPNVTGFHDEHVQFGGAGITVVEL